MGMYDSIKCEYELPVPDCLKDIDFKLVQEAEFQTKDFDSSLDWYKITKDGRLLIKKAEYKWIDDDNSFLKGYLDEVSSVLENVDFHGELLFYCFEYIQKDDKEYSVSVDYIAKFTDGVLSKIQIKNAEIEETTERKEKLKQLIQQQKEINERWYNKYFLRSKIARKVRNKLYRSVVCVQRNVNDIFYFILRHL